MVIHSAVRRTLLTAVIRLFVLSMSAMDVLRETRLQSEMRMERFSSHTLARNAWHLLRKFRSLS